MLPLEVERLQSQLTAKGLSVDEFFNLVLSMFEFECSKEYLRTVIHNLRIIMTETVWSQSNRQIHADLVDRYQDFFCEEIDHSENVERYDWKDGIENYKLGFDDENDDYGFPEDSSSSFNDDSLDLNQEKALAFNLSLNEIASPASEQIATLPVPSSVISVNSSKKRKKKKNVNDSKLPVILWFRRDLRTYDNPALTTAVNLNKPVIPIFLWNEEDEGPLASGGATKVWLEEALKAFQETLHFKYESQLILRSVKSYLEEIKSIMMETGAKDVVWTALYEPALAQRDKRIEESLRKSGVRVHVEHSYLLHRPEQVRVQGVGVRGIGSVTHFMECCKQNPGDKIGVPLDPPKEMISPSAWPSSCQLSDLGLYSMPKRKDGSFVDWAQGIRENWRFGEEGGYENLRRFLDENVNKYESESGRADQPWTAVISPYLHWGELSPRLVLHEAFIGKIATKFRRKLAWRDLSYWLLNLFPSMDREPIRSPFKNQAWNEDRKLLTLWQKGLTGFPLVDAAMKQLWSIGWMNNYMRHVVASFLMSYLRFSWLDGYRWFQDTLVDADVAINAMMWQNGGFSGLDQWNFVMHPVNAAMTCDPRGDFVRRWVPQLSGLPDKFIHQPWKCPPGILKRNKVEFGVNYPHRCISDLEAERERSLADVVHVRRKFGGGFIDPQHGRDMVTIPFNILGLESKKGKDILMVPLITRKEFIYKTGRPESEDNPYNPVLKGYVNRERDEEVLRTNRVDFTASTMLEEASRKQRVDRINGEEEKEKRMSGTFGGRGMGRRNVETQRRTKTYDPFTKV